MLVTVIRSTGVVFMHSFMAAASLYLVFSCFSIVPLCITRLPYKRLHLRLRHQRLIPLHAPGLRIFGAAFLPHAGDHARTHAGDSEDLLGGTASAVELHGAFAVAVNTALA